MTLQDTTIVITGASKGLGRALALHCGQSAANLVLVARSWDLLEDVRAEIEALAGKTPMIMACDITSEEDVQQMAERIAEQHPVVDVLINNAGFGHYRVSEVMTNPEMRRHFEVNFFGAYYCIKALLPMMKRSASGYILNVGSFFSQMALAETGVYAATKFALAGFSQGLRRELKPLGIKVGLFLPGPIRTSFHMGQEGRMMASPALMLDPRRVAMKMVKMIRQRRRRMVFPYWMMAALKLRCNMGK